MKYFDKIYPFTTEMISKYFRLLDLEDKKVLTVGSSLDQAFNAILLGAKDVTVIDISKKTKDFLKLKKEILLNTKRENFYNEVLKNIKKENIETYNDIFEEIYLINMNLYMQSDDKYKQLQEKIKDSKIKVIEGDIFKLDEVTKEKYDRIIFSNAVQYIDDYTKLNNITNDNYEFLKDRFEYWKEYLNDLGIIQLLYYYSYTMDIYLGRGLKSTMNYNNVRKALNYEILLERITNNFDREDAIVTYKKR